MDAEVLVFNPEGGRIYVKVRTAEADGPAEYEAIVDRPALEGKSPAERRAVVVEALRRARAERQGLRALLAVGQTIQL
jgi:hypothetical protein